MLIYKLSASDPRKISHQAPLLMQC